MNTDQKTMLDSKDASATDAGFKDAASCPTCGTGCTLDTGHSGPHQCGNAHTWY